MCRKKGYPENDRNIPGTLSSCRQTLLCLVWAWKSQVYNLSADKKLLGHYFKIRSPTSRWHIAVITNPYLYTFCNRSGLKKQKDVNCHFSQIPTAFFYLSQWRLTELLVQLSFKQTNSVTMSRKFVIFRIVF